MPRYLIETPHRAQDCRLILEQIHAQGYLHRFEWGCKQDVHCGWAMLEAQDAEHAKLVLPTILRDKARVVQLVSFSPEDAKDLHEE